MARALFGAGSTPAVRVSRRPEPDPSSRVTLQSTDLVGGRLQQLSQEGAVEPTDLHLQRALECFLLADELPTSQEREALRDLAMQWLRLTERQDEYWRQAAPPRRGGRKAFH
jgi:hypothetical protein